MLAIGATTLILVLVVVAKADFENDEPVDYSGYEILNVGIGNEKEAGALKLIAEELQLDFWNEPNSFVGYSLVQVPPQSKSVLKAVLKGQGFNFSTAIEDFQSAILKEREESNPRNHEYKRDLASFNYARYRQLNEINSFLNEVQQQYPNLANVFDIGTTYEGRHIYGIRITGSTPGTKPVVFLECGIHAREWATVASALYFIGELTTKSNTPAIATLINNFEWHIIPTTNPDGYYYTHTRNRSWRKTRSQSRVQPTCYGADPNRNFDTAFCTAGASKNPCSDTYCGDYAFSEKETQALRNYLTKLGSRIKVYFGIHTFGQMWMYPYGYTNAAPANANQLHSIGAKGVAALSKRYGTQYRLGSIATVIYEASGSSVDWVYDKIGVRVAYALELRDRGIYGFILPQNQIIPTASETFDGISATVLNA